MQIVLDVCMACNVHDCCSYWNCWCSRWCSWWSCCCCCCYCCCLLLLSLAFCTELSRIETAKILFSGINISCIWRWTTKIHCAWSSWSDGFFFSYSSAFTCTFNLQWNRARLYINSPWRSCYSFCLPVPSRSFALFIQVSFICCCCACLLLLIPLRSVWMLQSSMKLTGRQNISFR